MPVDLLLIVRKSCCLFTYRRPLPLLGLHVRQAFFHCPKYIKTRIPGLTAAVASPSEETLRLRRLMNRSQGYLFA
jgi:hypothetical protein